MRSFTCYNVALTNFIHDIVHTRCSHFRECKVGVYLNFIQSCEMYTHQYLSCISTGESCDLGGGGANSWRSSLLNRPWPVPTLANHTANCNMKNNVKPLYTLFFRASTRNSRLSDIVVPEKKPFLFLKLTNYLFIKMRWYGMKESD